jgi:hypothetical protein
MAPTVHHSNIIVLFDIRMIAFDCCVSNVEALPPQPRGRTLTCRGTRSSIITD